MLTLLIAFICSIVLYFSEVRLNAAGLTTFSIYIKIVWKILVPIGEVL
jgi:hypothetical protein